MLILEIPRSETTSCEKGVYCHIFCYRSLAPVFHHKLNNGRRLLHPLGPTPTPGLPTQPRMPMTQPIKPKFRHKVLLKNLYMHLKSHASHTCLGKTNSQDLHAIRKSVQEFRPYSWEQNNIHTFIIIDIHIHNILRSISCDVTPFGLYIKSI